MKVSYNWLKEFIDLELSPEETTEKLTLSGLEVEEVESYGSDLEGVVIGEVLEVKPHPNADRLFLCRVNIGTDELQIVCGADNVAEGQKVPVATEGTTLPLKLENGSRLTIKKAKLRGEESNGMICAEDELGLGTDHDGIMVLDENLEPGTAFNQAYDLYRDTVIDIAITPNRPDATCHLGVARDLSAALGLPLKKPFETAFETVEPLSDRIEIRIESPEKCHRYVGKLVEKVTVGESPAWLANRLKALGIRPVNNVVDATNYVLFEMGQPLHAFDFDAIRGKKIVVKDFDKDTIFETLDHVKRKCSAGTLFICDGEGPVAIAGVMGGVDSEVSGKTTSVLIESAWFEPGTIRRTAKEQGLQTDASYRFERGIDPAMQRIAAERTARLIADISGGKVVEGCTDVHPVKTEPRELTLRMSYLNRLLGTDFDVNRTEEILTGLELEVVSKTKDSIKYRIPTFRPDLEREVDLIEEVGRLYDYNNIPPPSHTKFAPAEPLSEYEQLLSKVKEMVKAFRFREIYSNSLMPEKEASWFGELDEMIHTLNPISKDMTTLRPSLAYGFLKAVSYNFNRKSEGVRFFETGNIFYKDKEGSWFTGIGEETHLLMGLAGFKTIEHWKTDLVHYDIFDLKACVATFLEQLEIEEQVETKSENATRLFYLVDESVIGELYEVDRKLRDRFEIELPAFIAEFSLSAIMELSAKIRRSGYRPVSRFPSFEFDLAVVVDRNVPAGNMMQTMRGSAGPSLNRLQVFDVFEGESLGKDKKSVAFRLSFLDENKTLTINDVEPIINKMLKALEKQFSAKLRS